jgi:hypothetical protein
MAEIKNEEGKTYGYWKVLHIDTARGPSGGVKWVCRCVCGNERSVPGLSLRNGRSKSCGCGVVKIKSSGETPYKRVFQVTKTGAEGRGLDFSLSYKDFKEIVHRNCYLCGCEPKDKHYSYNRLRYSRGEHEDEYAIFNGIDRVDSSLGYSIENCKACCFVCNRMKTDFSLDFFLGKIVEINQNMEKSNVKGNYSKSF